jgi:hypothetical protein
MYTFVFRKFQAIACDPILWSWYIFSAEAVRAHGLGKLLQLPRFQVEMSQQYENQGKLHSDANNLGSLAKRFSLFLANFIILENISLYPGQF